MLHEHDRQRQPVFPPVRRPRRSEPARDRNARRHAHQLWRSDRPRRPDGERAGGARRQARRPRRGADRKIGAGAGAVSRDGSRRRGLPAAQHRLHAERARLLHRRRRAVAGGLRPLEGGRHRRDRGEGQRQGRDARRRRQGIADGRRRQGRCGIRDRRARQRRSRRDPLHVGHHGPLQGRDADARQSRVELATAWSTTGASPTRTC